MKKAPSQEEQMGSAEDEMKTVMGGEAEDKEYDLAERVRNAIPASGDYSGCAEYAAQRIMAAAARDPRAFASAVEEYRANPYTSAIDMLLTPEDRAEIIESGWGITGFQWGWAVNSALYLMEQPPAPNPAIDWLKT